jgi:hypothetical protein
VLQEMLARIPEFELDPDDKPERTKGQVSGFGKVPLVFPAADPRSSGLSMTSPPRVGPR